MAINKTISCIKVVLYTQINTSIIKYEARSTETLECIYYENIQKVLQPYVT